MDSDERPRKLPKLGHDGAEDATHSELGPAMTAMTGAVAPTDEPQNAAVSSIEADKATSELQTNTTNDVTASTAAPTEGAEEGAPKMSKNQLKKIRKREKWEEDRDNRRVLRRQKAAEKRDRRNAKFEEARATGDEEALKKLKQDYVSMKSKRKRSTLIPFTIVIDCGYDELMHDRERISLASQLTRSYSDNNRAAWRGNMMFSSFNKLLKERFDTILAPYVNWKGIKIIPEDFMEAAEIAKKHMASPRGGKLVGPFAEMGDAKPEGGEIIYLSSDSENTLTELKPYNTYIIGGLVDKNRHKAVCYNSALAKGVKTAKLPIGDYIQMASRSILTTNHVIEIMLQWLELGDWGEAFLKVLPQRKGRKSDEAGADVEEEYGDEDEDDAGAEEDQLAAVEAAGGDEAEENS
ncbi:uncharacterized protein N7483_007230 [Penicillium malachiteum]|uniref:uncharacterized protein n=1 Tax=Penicillium malachiteum TaxID=1324776 RepID=UPI0025498087|nr:uncharacterized protein N7483_007230 [Penicillium malachiteum]KAJ5725873.1 hypothetical protein N7483_007230 [Penicillium malachiteum]